MRRQNMEPSEVGQLLLVGVPGPELDSEMARVFERIQPGGFILFGRNIKSAGQLRRLVDDLRNLSRSEPIITIDQEGGRVSRLRLIGFEPPNAQQLREKGEENFIAQHGRLTGKLLRLFGFNLDLCPVLDLSFAEDADNSLRGRCYGRTVAEVQRFAGIFHQALQATGIQTSGKHFPGYGAASFDPHHELPVIRRSRADLEAAELAVYRHFVPFLSSIMVGHAWYPSLDPEQGPASLSGRIVSELLRKELGFQGLIMTDDLDMGAILNQFDLAETVRRAVFAGQDLLMICHRLGHIEEAGRLLGHLPSKALDRALRAVNAFKKKLSPPEPFSEQRFREIDQQIGELRVAVLGAERAAEQSAEDGKRSPVELY
jgi:beta-N-acetylhexosaminidase